jgi:hypothetical protein
MTKRPPGDEYQYAGNDENTTKATEEVAYDLP